jgi:hypothetical protein
VAFVPEKQNRDRWLTLPSSEQTGSKVQVMFRSSDGAMVTRYVLDPRIVRADLERNRQSREIWKKGSLLGNTQKHIVPIAHIPYEKYAQLKKRFGKDTKALLKFWNNSDHGAWKASEYKF